jgi:membrane associated rhomboid family serine protease
VSSTELNVVCRNCGEQVSPYVTECPYCGTRLRKRAPKLELRGDEITPRVSRRARRRAARARRLERLGERPYAVMFAILAPALLVLIRTASPPATIESLGAIIGPVEGEWWRYLTAPFVYPDVPYLAVAAAGIAIFGIAVERRLGTIATAILIIACGSLGMVAANGADSAIGGNDILLAAGGNGVALGLLATWAMLRAAEVRGRPDEDVEVIGAAVAAAVLIMLPLVDDWADVFAGLGGGLVGVACGLAASFARREKRPG